MEGNIRKRGLVCQENLNRKMCGAAPMAVPVAHCDIYPYKKSVHLLTASSEKQLFFAEFRQTSPARLFFTMRYDWMYSSRE